VLIVPAFGHAQELAPEKMMAFADHLFSEADYYRAITEYERLIFYYPVDPAANTAKFQIALSYLKGNRLPQAIQSFLKLSNEFPDEEVGKKSMIMLADAYALEKDYHQAIIVLEKFASRFPQDARADAVRIKIGWCQLRQGNWREASGEFKKLPVDSRFRKQAEGMAEDAAAFGAIPAKSPAIAGGLSAVLPGAGQVYVGRYADAAVAFFLNGLFIGATAESFRTGNATTGAVFLFFESGWYLGNIYNAISSAHKFNRRSEEAAAEKFKNQYGILLGKDEQGQELLALTIRF